MGEVRSGQKLELIELIYAAGLDPGGWGVVVARLGELLSYASVAFQLIDLLQKAPAICLAENWEGGASQSMEGLLDRTPFPVFLVTADAAVRHLNEPAARAIEERRGLLLASLGRLAFARAEETAKLHRMIKQSAGLGAATADGFMTFTAPGEPGPNMAWISPLVPKSSQALLRLVASADREVLVTLQYRRDEAVIPQERLKSAFDFTEAESQVVLALVKGESLADHAEATERSVHTVRLHLKRALSKAGCHSQSELVALVWRTIGQPI